MAEANTKVTKKSVNYRSARGYRKCANCVMFKSPNQCTLVAGSISKMAVCDKWEPKE